MMFIYIIIISVDTWNGSWSYLLLKVLEKNAKNFSLDQYAAMMAVNGFRGYMTEYMKSVLAKHVSKETKSKKKKTKDDVIVSAANNWFYKLYSL